MDFSHLDAIQLRLSNERIRYSQSKGKEKEFRARCVASAEKELAGEKKFLGIEHLDEMSEDELLKELGF